MIDTEGPRPPCGYCGESAPFPAPDVDETFRGVWICACGALVACRINGKQLTARCGPKAEVAPDAV